MKSFDIPAASRLKVIKVTPRKEAHGKDLVQAISLRLEWWPTENSAVNLLHDGLQDMIFWTPPEVAAQMALDGIPPVKKHIRVPTVARPWKVEAAFTGYTVTIEHGIDEESALELYVCALDKFEVDAKEGGASPIRWSLASNKQITPQLVGALCALEGGEIVATFTPPTAEQVIDGTTGHPGLAGAGDERDATDLFAAGDPGEGDPDEHDGDGIDTDPARSLEAALDAGEREQADLEDGLRQSIAAAKLKPKRQARGTAH